MNEFSIDFSTVILLVLVITASGCVGQTSSGDTNISESDVTEVNKDPNSSDMETSQRDKISGSSGTAIFKFVNAASNEKGMRYSGSEHSFGKEVELGLKMRNIGDGSGNFSRTVELMHGNTGESFTKNFTGGPFKPGKSGWVNDSFSLDLMGYWSADLEHSDQIWSYNVRPPMGDVGEKISTSRLEVTLSSIDFRDSYTYTDGGDQYTDGSGEYQSFVVLDFSFENNADEKVSVPPRDAFVYELDGPYEVRGDPEFEMVNFGAELEPGETATGKVVFREKSSKDWHIPEEYQLTYADEGFNGIWNITREEWPEDIEITKE